MSRFHIVFIVLIFAMLLVGKKEINISVSAQEFTTETNPWINSITFPRLLSRHVYSGIPANLDPVRYSKYDLVYASPFSPESLRVYNPKVRVLIYDSARAAQTENDLNVLKPKEYLLYAGSKLTQPTGDTDTIIYVADGSRFKPNYDAVFLDTTDPKQAEHVHIQEVGVGGNPNALQVIRGFKGRGANLVEFSPKRAHAQSSEIAMHVMGEKILEDDFDPEAVRNKWLINIYTAYDITAKGMVDKVLAYQMDGLKIDSAKTSGVGPKIADQDQIDINNDLVPDGGVINGQNLWREGILNLFKSVRTKLAQSGRDADHALVVANGAEPNQWINGRLVQAWWARISAPTLNEATISEYRRHFQEDASPQITNVDIEIQNYALSRKEEMQKVRFGLASALVNGNGFFGNKAEIPENHSHGTDAWYDEYDNGAGSAIEGHSVSETANQIEIAKGTGQKFRPGDIIYLTSETMKVVSINQGELTDFLTVERAFVTDAQRQFLTDFNSPMPVPVKHQLGEKVYTDLQAKSGKGYLGRPLTDPSTNCSTTGFIASNCMRYFDGGVVLVNPTSSTQTFPVSGTYYRIDGSQDPEINNGLAAGTSVSVGPLDGLILVKKGPKLADANNDSKVDTVDFGIWKLNFGKAASAWPSGYNKANFNSDGLVNSFDFKIWSKSVGN